jgi:hypothetical protein
MPRVECILQIAFKANMDYEDEGSREGLHMENLCLEKPQSSWRSIKMERTWEESPSIINTGHVEVHTL